MSVTDYLKLSEHKIFKEALEVLPKTVNKPLNLLTVRDSVLFTWDFSNNCVLSLNVKAARGKEGHNVIHQKLLPLHPPLFTPEYLDCNETGTLLIVAGPNGVLVLKLPGRCPPYGAYDSNKELVYCRSYSLDERLLSCSDVVHVRRAKFHPGSANDCHILVLTSDNMFRLYQVQNNEALHLGVYPIGESPGGTFPGTKTTFLDIYGEIAVDFDFGHPEILEKTQFNLEKSRKYTGYCIETKNNQNKVIPKKFEVKKKEETNQHENLAWPIYILRGDFSIFTVIIDLNRQIKPVLKGPCPISEQPIAIDNEACSIICLKTLPQIICIASSSGVLTNSILLNIDGHVNSLTKEPTKELFVFETVELELGLSVELDDTSEESTRYKCPIFLQKDESKVSRYFAVHAAGVHMININCTEDLHSYITSSEDVEPTSDLFVNPSSSEYLICTRTLASEKSNPVLGFALYYEPTSVIALLNDSSVFTLGILPAAIEDNEKLLLDALDKTEVQSPLKKMLNEPFDQYIQKILKKGCSRPLLKLSSTSGDGPDERYELIQRTAQIFREEHFKHFTKAREELDKRVHTLTLLKKAQKQEIEKMTLLKEELRVSAENLAEKYEDIKDKQDELLKRCEQLLMLVSRKRVEPTEAERGFMKDMQRYREKCVVFQKAIDTVKKKKQYQEVQIQSFKAQESKKVPVIGEMQSKTIKDSLHESTQKIDAMIKQVNEYKSLLNLK
ncbi:hypothetical protein ABEB36_006780 [Hypothenemus hampei]|uniref:Nuclear pore complex protein Nup88 n=1 Tax=Hypothenemus hampei TaxID=57062 RepID=A0ABD1EUS6_HYPHA